MKSVTTVFFLFVLVVGCDQNEKIPSPNIVFILVDDLGWTDTGFNGSAFYETPNMDALANEGINFTQAYSAAAVCSPTRASIVTGQYPARLQLTTHIPSMAKGWNMGIPPENTDYTLDHPASPKQTKVPNRNFLPLEETTIAELLKKGGYATGYIGKWHLGHEDFHLVQQGFDRQEGVTNFGQPMSYYFPYQRNHRGESYAMESLGNNAKSGEYLTDRLGREALAFIEDNKNKPFFLQLAFYAVHTPIQPPKDKLSHFEQKAKSETHGNVGYASMIHKVDENIGKLMDKLKTLQLDDSTMVVLYSDNGGFLGVTSNTPLRKGKGYAYEGGIRVPLVIKWPAKLKGAQESGVPISSIDFMPTFCAAAGINMPKGQIADGDNILNLITQKDNGERELFWHFPHYRGNDIMPYSIIRKGDWKLIKRYDGKQFELFNLNEDLSERNGLSLAMPDKVAQMNKYLEGWLKETNAKIPKL